MSVTRMYQAKREIVPRNGSVQVYPELPERVKVELWQQADLCSGHISYTIIAPTLERGVELYHAIALPEIERKEKLYLAAGKFDHQNN